MALKFHEDDYFGNNFYADVGGVHIDELNAMEVELLNLLDWSLFIDDESFNKYKSYFDQYDVSFDIENSENTKKEICCY